MGILGRQEELLVANKSHVNNNGRMINRWIEKNSMCIGNEEQELGTDIFTRKWSNETGKLISE